VHQPCQHGLCPAHCPVRPDVFGFYGTQWRRWPGSGIVQASSVEAATPARPSRSAIPGPQEESLESPPTGEPAAAVPRQPAAFSPTDDSRTPAAARRAPPMEGGDDVRPDELPADAAPQSAAERPAAAAEGVSPPADRPAREKSPAAGENLFNLDDLDDRPLSTPWRAFTAESRREARGKR
jgi:hypothetical protein